MGIFDWRELLGVPFMLAVGWIIADTFSGLPDIKQAGEFMKYLIYAVAFIWVGTLGWRLKYQHYWRSFPKVVTLVRALPPPSYAPRTQRNLHRKTLTWLRAEVRPVGVPFLPVIDRTEHAFVDELSRGCRTQLLVRSVTIYNAKEPYRFQSALFPSLITSQIICESRFSQILIFPVPLHLRHITLPLSHRFGHGNRLSKKLVHMFPFCTTYPYPLHRGHVSFPVPLHRGQSSINHPGGATLKSPISSPYTIRRFQPTFIANEIFPFL